MAPLAVVRMGRRDRRVQVGVVVQVKVHPAWCHVAGLTSFDVWIEQQARLWGVYVG